ncbi:hypothetical protein B14911_12877 [Bacillus sp. NRRL B-14911]|uniref:Uncharacterized protein n=1 Tax=Bacillus infantis NRRL B-14911 TaxID=1367477 RepID=U5LH03_9BACI|nr:hypothetical protein N288_24555 [Bacillus infantis NRRL B-14911]EAR67658.1 hypothetical protein B14911_12877 [Bacillus sp. NRRL B-14911]PLR73312.1 hypothetical protein CYJ37_07115 [Bacillus sp. UMB0728]
MNSCPERTGGFASAARGIDCRRLVLQNDKASFELSGRLFFTQGLRDPRLTKRKPAAHSKTGLFPLERTAKPDNTVIIA